jgi:hypothetical protein
MLEDLHFYSIIYDLFILSYIAQKDSSCRLAVTHTTVEKEWQTKKDEIF